MAAIGGHQVGLIGVWEHLDRGYGGFAYLQSVFMLSSAVTGLL